MYRLLRRFAFIGFACLASLLSANAAVAACATNEIDALGDGTQCETAKFSVTTRSNATTLIWTMSATGPFYVDCGDGGTLTQSGTTTGSTISGNTITRTGTDSTTYTCTWVSSGAHTVRFGGTATGYNTSTSVPTISFYQFSGGTQAKVASVSGSLGAMFPVVGGNIPRFYQTFYNCNRLTSLPAGLFSGIDTSSATNTSYMFNGTFNNTGITSIPAGLFSGVDTSSATNTRYMFFSTFGGCSSLTSLPAGLFSAIDTSSATDTSYMFYSTFSRTGITSLPAGLFSAIDTSSATNTSQMFYQTFYNCSSLGGYIPPTTFPSTIHPGSNNTKMWYRIFNNTQLATSCDSFPGTTQYITGFESDWAGKVSCQTCAEAGMAEYAGKCRTYCSAMSVLHAGNYEYPLLTDRTGVPAPVLALKKNDDVCYLYMEQDDNLDIPGLHIKYDNHTYSPVSLAQPG